MRSNRVGIHEDSRSSKSTLELMIINLISYFIFLAIAIFIMWAQISHHAFIAGTDSTFHMNRFYETAMQIKTGHFSYFQSLFAFHQTGRIVTAFYGPVMAYLFGGLLLICKNWINFQIISSLLVLSISGWLMYVLAVKNNVKRWVALVVGTMYMTSNPINIWPTDQQFTGLGGAILPLAIICGMQMLNKHQVKILPLALTITLLVQTHILSSIVAVMALIPLFIVGMIKSKHRSLMLTNVFKAAGLTILLTGNVWGSIVEMFTTNHIIPVFPQQDLMSGTIHFYHGYLSYLGLIMTVIVVLVILTLIFRWQSYSYRWKTIVFTGLLFLWLSTPWFPWTWIHNHWIFITNLIQFPRRFLIIAIILFLLAFGQSCSRQSNSNWAYKGLKLHYLKIIVLMAFMICTINGLRTTFNYKVEQYDSSTVLNEPETVVHVNIRSPRHLRHAFQSSNLRSAVYAVIKYTPDYLPSKNSLATNQDYYRLHPYNLENVQLDSNQSQFYHQIINRDQLRLCWFNHQKHLRPIIIPLVAYHQTQVMVNGKLNKDPSISSVGALKIHPRPGWNRVTIGFHPDLSLEIMMAITVITWLAVIGYLLICRRQKPKRTE